MRAWAKNSQNNVKPTDLEEEIFENKLYSKESSTGKNKVIVLSMSLLREIRRQHKGFVLKRSAQIFCRDKASSVSSVDDSKDGDEDEDADLIVESSHQADVQNVHVSVAASPRHETHQMPSPNEGHSVHKDVSAQSLICIPTGVVIDKDAGMIFGRKESRCWPRVAKTAVFLLVTAGAVFFGKLTALGATLTVALAGKLFPRGRINKCESFISAGTGECCHSYESLPSSSELARLDTEDELPDESKILFAHPLGDVAIDTNGHSQMDVEAIGNDQIEETLSIKATGELARKQLKRLDYIKLPPPPSSSIEAMDGSPCSSAKASPRTWFHNAGRSMAALTGKDIVASSAEMIKQGSAEMIRQGKFKSKVLLRHLRKGEPQSAPSSPSRSSKEASHSFCAVSDGSDSERPAHPADPMHTKSKLRSVSSIAKEASRAVLNMISSLKKGGMKLSRETLSPDICISPFQKGEGRPSSFMPATPTSFDATTKLGIHAHSASTHEHSHRRRGRHQCTRKPVTPISQDAVTANAFVPANQDSLQGSVQKGGEKNQQQVRVGTLWIALGLFITVAGLFMGRTVAVAGLVCYWYALSLKSRKASGRRRRRR